MRVNIYVGEDLRARMEKVKVPVNWSQVASQAFEAKLAEIAEQKTRKTMSDVIQRLRASKMKHENAQEKGGRTAGTKWAQNAATWAQLSDLASLHEKANGDVLGYMGDNAALNLGLTILACDDPRDFERVSEFWEKHAGQTSPSDDFAIGFYEGALDVYEQVRPEV